MSSEFRRMFETRTHRPYYTVANLGGMGKPLFDVSGFGYRKTVYIISPAMNNSAYFHVAEMEQATRHFRELWDDENRVTKILGVIKEAASQATRAEERAWRQSWSSASTPTLVREMRSYFDLLMRSLGTMYVSNPQHVAPLEERINALVEGEPDPDSILTPATTFEGKLPWSDEDEVIAGIRGRWGTYSDEEQERALDGLVARFGWLNEIEGDRPFGREHYRQKILTTQRDSPALPAVAVASEEIRKLGRLIGELTYLRLWNRHHFMHLRYHLKKILGELTRRSHRPELEFATVEEVDAFFRKEPLNFEEIGRRSEGYAAHLDGRREPHIITGDRALSLRDMVSQESIDDGVVRGNIANRGRAEGVVRIIGFSASDYDEQVAAFQDGEVLVTGMTRPQIAHLCAKASAIVTDEGGITCHAVIVSREYGIPCIIATHNATKVLTTGTRVIVDATQGLEGTVTRVE